jgi:hypothetical protein
MVQRTLILERNPEGTPTMTAGGGSFRNTYIAQTILTPAPEGYALKEAIFIKINGHRASSTEQAVIPVEIGDVVINMEGKLPISDLNPDAKITAYRITDIDLTTAKATEIPVTHKDIPPKVITGAGKWHNRDGAYFCSNPVNEEVVKPCQR